MAHEKHKLNPRIVLAVASTLCASSMAQDTPAKPPEAPAPVQPAAENPAPAAQAAPPPAEPDLMSALGTSKPSANVTINLIKRMVKKGLLTADEAAELIAQSEQDTVVARNQVRDDAQIATQMVIQQAVAQKVIPNLEPMLDDSVRVTYIPDVVKSRSRTICARSLPPRRRARERRCRRESRTGFRASA